MTDIAIRVDNLSKLYHLGAVHQRPDTLRDALTGFLPRISPISRKEKDNSNNSPSSRQDSDCDDLWALKDVSFEAGLPLRGAPQSPVEGSSAARWWASAAMARARARC